MAVPHSRAGHKWFTQHHYGINTFPNDDHLEVLLKAVLVIAKGDGAISPEERNFFIGYLDAVGLPENRHNWPKDYQGDDRLEDLLAGSGALNDNTKRIILYTAILVSAVDGYHEGEHASVVKAGAILGVSEDVVNQIADQYRAEAKAFQQRNALLFANGRPAWVEDVIPHIHPW